MSRVGRGWVVLALLFFACSGPRSPRAESSGPGASEAVLFVSADLQGYLGPCGCSDNMPGGIARAAAQVQAARKQTAPVLFFDAGDALFGHASLAPEEVVQETRKAQSLAEAFTAMGVQGKSVGPLDRVGGDGFLDGLHLPLVHDGSSVVRPLGRGKVAWVTASSLASLQAGARRARAQGAWLVVAAWLGKFSQAQALVERTDTGADLLVAAHADEAANEGEVDVQTRGALPLLAPKSRGRTLLRLDVSSSSPGPFEFLTGAADVEREVAGLTQRLALLDRQINQPGMLPEMKQLLAKKITEVVARREAAANVKPKAPTGHNAFAVRFVSLEATLPEEPTVSAIVHRYDHDVSQLNLAWAKEHGQDCAPAPKGEPAYVGSAACEDCHADPWKVYRNTKHAHAYATLVSVDKQYRVDCIACHVVGIQQPGGVCRVDKVKGRENVGCENCHGPGSIHVADPSDDNIPRPHPKQNVCVGCHNAENSPHFDYAAYLPQILGPGHGK